MTFEELLKACASGKLPTVRLLIPIMNVFGPFGRITTIKDNGKYKGVGVSFASPKYEVWFWDSDEADKRSHYMKELEIADDF